MNFLLIVTVMAFGILCNPTIVHGLAVTFDFLANGSVLDKVRKKPLCLSSLVVSIVEAMFGFFFFINLCQTCSLWEISQCREIILHLLRGFK